MCYGKPTESIEIARKRMTPEQWEKFEADFQHFCAYSGLLAEDEFNREAMLWAKWAYLCGKGL